jgi:hypothetical protein
MLSAETLCRGAGRNNDCGNSGLLAPARATDLDHNGASARRTAQLLEDVEPGIIGGTITQAAWDNADPDASRMQLRCDESVAMTIRLLVRAEMRLGKSRAYSSPSTAKEHIIVSLAWPA